MNEPIVVELVERCGYFRRGCHVCGGHTEKVTVLAEVVSGEYQGMRVCETCLKAGDIDARLAAHADTLEAQAALLREVIGRVKVPSFEDWERKAKQVDDEIAAAYEREAEAVNV